MVVDVPTWIFVLFRRELRINNMGFRTDLFELSVNGTNKTSRIYNIEIPSFITSIRTPISFPLFGEGSCTVNVVIPAMRYRASSRHSFASEAI